MVKGYICKICKYETKERGWRNAQFEIEQHFEIKHKIFDIIGKDLVKSIKTKLSKKWECPICKGKMSYGNKYYHQANANRRGEPYMCIPKI